MKEMGKKGGPWNRKSTGQIRWLRNHGIYIAILLMAGPSVSVLFGALLALGSAEWTATANALNTGEFGFLGRARVIVDRPASSRQLAPHKRCRKKKNKKRKCANRLPRFFFAVFEVAGVEVDAEMVLKSEEVPAPSAGRPCDLDDFAVDQTAKCWAPRRALSGNWKCGQRPGPECIKLADSKREKSTA